MIWQSQVNLHSQRVHAVRNSLMQSDPLKSVVNRGAANKENFLSLLWTEIDVKTCLYKSQERVLKCLLHAVSGVRKGPGASQNSSMKRTEVNNNLHPWPKDSFFFLKLNEKSLPKKKQWKFSERNSEGALVYGCGCWYQKTPAPEASSCRRCLLTKVGPTFKRADKNLLQPGYSCLIISFQKVNWKHVISATGRYHKCLYHLRIKIGTLL